MADITAADRALLQEIAQVIDVYEGETGWVVGCVLTVNGMAFEWDGEKFATKLAESEGQNG